jgi:hypothetical protein
MCSTILCLPVRVQAQVLLCMRHQWWRCSTSQIKPVLQFSDWCAMTALATHHAGALHCGSCCALVQDVKSIAWHPSRELLASCSYDNSIKLWANDEADWLCVQTLEGECSEGGRGGTWGTPVRVLTGVGRCCCRGCMELGMFRAQ